MSEQVKQPDRLTLADAMAALDKLVPLADHCTIEMELLRYSGKWRIEWKAYTKQTGYSEEHQTLAAALAEVTAKLEAHRLTLAAALKLAEMTLAEAFAHAQREDVRLRDEAAKALGGAQ